MARGAGGRAGGGSRKAVAHIGLKAVDDLAEERHGQAYSNYKAGAIALPESETQVQMLLTRYCGGGAVRVLTEGTVNHLQVCPVLGRNSAPHDAVRDVLSHLVVQNSVTDAAVVETRLAAADGRTYDADVVYFDPSSRARVILEVSIVTIGNRVRYLTR